MKKAIIGIILLVPALFYAQVWHVNYNWKCLHLRTAAQRSAAMCGGESYQQLMDIRFSEANPNIVYMTSDTSQVWKSTDAGNTWFPKPNGLMCNGGLSLLINPADANTVLLAGFAGEGDGIYKTENGGENWIRTKNAAGYNKVALVRGQNLFCYKNGYVYATLQNGEGIIRSSDFGDTWSVPISFDSASDIPANRLGYILNMVQNPNQSKLELWVCSYSGLYKITNTVTGYNCKEIAAAGLPGKYTGWVKSADPAGVKTSIDSIDSYSFPGGLRLDFDGSADPNYYHTKWANISVTAGTGYTVEGYIKTENLITSKGVCISVQDARGYTYGSWTSTAITGTSGWIQVKLSFVIPADSTTSLVNILIRRTSGAVISGIAWFDNIKFYKTSDGTAGNLLKTSTGMEDYAGFDGDTPTAVHFAKGSSLLLSCGLSGLYRSDDSGKTFVSANTGLSTYRLNRYRLNLNGSIADRNILVAGFNMTGGIGNFKTINAGTNWTEMTELDGSLQYDVYNVNSDVMYESYYAAPTAFHPTSSAVMIRPYICSAIYKSVDTGNSWSFSGNGYSGGRVAGGMTSFAFAEDDPLVSYFFLTDYGVLFSGNGGRTWIRRVAPRYFAHTAPVGVINPYDNKIIVCPIGDWSQQVVDKSTDGGLTWKTNLTGSASSTGYSFMAHDPVNENIIYLDNKRSIDSGEHWTTLAYNVIAVSPGTGAIYAKTEGSTSSATAILVSYNNGDSWNKYYYEIPEKPANIKEAAICPTNDNTIYIAALYKGVFIMQNGGTWSLKNINNGITLDSFGNYSVQHITVDPVRPNVVYIGKRIQWKGHSDGVCVSVDSGSTWNNISRNLTYNSTVWAIKVNPDNDSVYIGSSHGTWVMSSLIANFHFDGANPLMNNSVYSINKDIAEEGDALRGSGTSYTGGIAGSGLAFNGTVDAYAEIPYTSAILADTNSISLELAVKFYSAASLQNGPLIADRNLFTQTNGFFLRSWYNKISFNVAKNHLEKYSIQGNTTLAVNTWYHIIAVFDRGDTKIYLNGTLDASGQAGFTGFIMQNVNPLYLGKCGINPANLNGCIDEVKIYNRALSGEEIKNKFKYMNF
ncbi:MAG: hypothetical protein A2096_07910 [Spirochaetes bacterium GWF1_41_5]|nr:MAG: hypothetical protein A2096_07910 [Spirochaetes bacterium GWF1_41_5]HBE02706.1 hypothetical protein [Spirochaetia bacterium]